MAEPVSGFKTVYHIDAGATRMLTIDANTAVGAHPAEWSNEPWSMDAAAAARAERQKRYAEELQASKVAGTPAPPPLPPVLELTDEEQATVDADAKARLEAAERVKAYEAKVEAKRLEDMQYQNDKVLLDNPPPAIDLTQRRPFGRPGPLTEKERALFAKRAAAAGSGKAKSTTDEKTES